MGSAGYGNHENAADAAAERPAPDAASKKPGAGSGERPVGEGHDTAAQGGDHRHQSTPGTGALPDASPKGGDVDPGVG
jgi:hypothetical protein